MHFLLDFVRKHPDIVTNLVIRILLLVSGTLDGTMIFVAICAVHHTAIVLRAARPLVLQELTTIMRTHLIKLVMCRPLCPY